MVVKVLLPKLEAATFHKFRLLNHYLVLERLVRVAKIRSYQSEA